jgi:3-phosphoglycerate kinase
MGGIYSCASHPGTKPGMGELRTTAMVIGEMGLSDRFTPIFTMGGACVEFLTGKKFPAIEALERSKKKFG